MTKRFLDFINDSIRPNIVDNDYYKKCIELAKNSKSASERYGALVVKNGDIIGEGYNRAIVHPRWGHKLDRLLKQGYANHSEVEAMDLALQSGNDLDGADIYVAGYFPKTNTLFFKEYFTCLKCLPFMEKFNIKNIYVPMPNGWIKRSVGESKEHAKLFHHGNVKGGTHQKRLDYLVGDYKLDLVE